MAEGTDRMLEETGVEDAAEFGVMLLRALRCAARWSAEGAGPTRGSSGCRRASRGPADRAKPRWSP